MKSQFLKVVEVNPNWRYAVSVTLDHAPERGEVGDIEEQIWDTFAKLGVSSESVGIIVFKSSTEFMPAPEYESDTPTSDKRYIGFLCLWSGEAEFTEDPAEVAERTRRAYLRYSGGAANSVEFVVLDNCIVEVAVNKPKSSPYIGVSIIGGKKDE